MKFLALLALLTFIAPVAAHAQNDDARVQTLKGQLEGFIEQQKSVALKNGCKLDTKGQITVEKAGSYYAFTLPHITYTDSKGIRTDIGMISINAVPDDNHEWKISTALPTPIKSFNAGGAEVFRTDIGTQNSSGIWNERLGHFTQVKSNYDNVQFKDLLDQSTVTVGALSLASQLQENDPEAYTGTAVATLDNISIFDAGTTFKGVMPKVTMSSNLADRAAKAPMTKEQVKNRPANGAYPDGYNIFAFLLGAPERVKVNITGLDSLSAQLQQAMITATPNQRAKLLQSILGVSAVAGMGQPVPGEASAKSYDVVFGANGNVTVNGTDLGGLMNSTTAPAAGSAPVIPVLR